MTTIKVRILARPFHGRLITPLLALALATLPLPGHSITAAAAPGTCPVVDPLPLAPVPTDADYEPGTTEIRADATRLVEDGVNEFSGDVEIMQDEQAIAAEDVLWNEAAGQLDFSGDVHMWGEALYWQGDSGTYRIDSSQAELRNGNYWLTGSAGRGAAESLENDGIEEATRLKRVTYTTCPEARESWLFSASYIKLNHVTDRGYARNAVLRAGRVPVIYLPYFSFPLSDKRKTGFLIPSIGSSTDSGIDARIPFYLNIAPNHDATLTPRILGERGVMLGAEYRYLTRFGGGEVGLQVLPGDSEFDDETRSLFTYRHLTLTDDTRGRVEVDYNDVSDPQYFEDFGRSLSTSSTRFLRQSALASYRGNWWTLYSRIESYEDVDTTLSANQLPYKRLPQLRLQVRRPLGSTRFDYGFSSDATYFDRDEGITGGRIDVRPFIRYNWRTAAAFVIPKLTVAHTRYLLDETPATADDTPDRTIPTLSVDSGIFLDRDFDFRGSRYLQTLEPRAFYLLTPRSGQDDLPVFDSGLYDFTFQNLYRENRFTGLDRVADANQLSLALTSRLLERETGAEFFRASFGQIYYFRDRNVALPGDLPDTRDTSEFIAEVAATTRFGLSARTTLQ
ncbi:MAG: LPS assembly protein LptD, partial [Gammaproteobacteria bacterium]|nr:LPS assembly protein LptD [Gammaproteobacteria bacterium]